jgi:hypothetical protein
LEGLVPRQIQPRRRQRRQKEGGEIIDAIFSVKPYFADAILEGTKKVELRTVAPTKPLERIWIYSTSPVQRIVGHFKPGKIRNPTDMEIAPYIDELGGRTCHAIEILEPTTLEPAINPRELPLGYLWLPAQSWRYCGQKEEAALRKVAP